MIKPYIKKEKNFKLVAHFFQYAYSLIYISLVLSSKGFFSMLQVLDDSSLWVNKIIYNEISLESFIRLSLHSLKILKHYFKMF